MWEPAKSIAIPTHHFEKSDECEAVQKSNTHSQTSGALRDSISIPCGDVFEDSDAMATYLFQWGEGSSLSRRQVVSFITTEGLKDLSYNPNLIGQSDCRDS